MLFDLYHSSTHGNSGSPGYELGCVLDEAMNAAGTIYNHKDIFRQLYIAEGIGQDDTVKAILRALKRDKSITEIAQELGRGIFRAGGTR